MHREKNYRLNFIKEEVLQSSKLKENELIKKAKILEKKEFAWGINFLNLWELYSLKRKPKILIYDSFLHFIGGAQRYGLTVAAVLQDYADVDIVSNFEISKDKLFQWYGLNLDKCNLIIKKISFFKNDKTINPNKISLRQDNPFDEISLMSANYDIFINNSNLEMLRPLSIYSLMIVHFPERRAFSYFFPNIYNSIIYVSNHTKIWLQNRWKLKGDYLLYPPIEMSNKFKAKKENIILSVSRFEEGGSKKQLEMVKAFHSLNQKYPSHNWHFLLIGGSEPNNPYLKEINDYINKNQISNINLKTNISLKELKEAYSSSSIFWHICGLNQKDPSRVEHFGMTTVEAMSNSLVPLVFKGGGQKEIVDDKINGFHVKSKLELADKTFKLMSDISLMNKMSKEALKKSEMYNFDNFKKNLLEIYKTILKEMKLDTGFYLNKE